MKQYQFTEANPPEIGQSYWAAGKLFHYEGTAGDQMLVQLGAFRHNSGVIPEADLGYIYHLLHFKGEKVMPVPVLNEREKATLRYIADPETAFTSMPDYYLLAEILKKHLIPFLNLAEGPQQNEQ